MGHDLALRGHSGGPLWNIYGSRANLQGVQVLDHLKGLYLPPKKLITTSAATQVGSTPRKTVEDQRVIEMLVATEGATQRDHDRVESAWWASWSHFEVSRLEVDNGARWLDARLLEYPDDPWTIHPEVNNWMEHDMRIVACNPAWQAGTRVTDEVTGTGNLIIPGISNPTDRPMWLNFVGTPGEYWIQDGLSNRWVHIQEPLTQRWKLYTDPQARSLEVEDGTGVWPKIMKGLTFRSPIPPGTEDATITVVRVGSGTGTIRAEMVDQYSRPWG